MDMFQMITTVVALAVVFGIPVLITVIISVYRIRANRLTHSTILALAERGMPIPPELLVPPQEPIKPKSDLKTGLILIAAGLGITLFFIERGGPYSFGAIPFLIGLGYIVAWKIEKPAVEAS